MNYEQREIVAFLRSIVQTPSVNGVNHEMEVARKILEFVKLKGLCAQIVSKDKNRPSLIISHNKNVRPKLLLIAHMDTVSPGQLEKWRYDPFGGYIANDRLYGRGAVDNKGGIASALACLLEMKSFPTKIQQGVALVCVPDEESGATGELGLGYLIDNKYIYPCDAIYTYPGMERIIVGHRGVLRLKVVTHGESVHSGSSKWQNKKTGCNAVAAMAEIILALEKMTFPSPNPDDEFSGFETTITPGTLISGGTGVSIVPDICTAMVDIRLIPSVSKQQVVSTVKALVANIAENRHLNQFLVTEEIYIPPTAIPRDSSIVVSLQKVISQNLGRCPKIALSGPANESYILNNNGFRTVVLGPEGGNMHSENEYIKLSSIFKVAKIYADTASLLLS